MTAIQEKLELKHITLATRLVCPPMATHSSGAEDGAPTEKLLRHYEAIARNPLVGLLELEHAYIAKSGTTGGNQLSLAEDRWCPSTGRWWHGSTLPGRGLLSFPRLTTPAPRPPASIPADRFFPPAMFPC